MSKIICEICGTSYQDTASCCPICGSTQEEITNVDELVTEEAVMETAASAEAVEAQKKKDIFDFDEVNTRAEEEDADDEDDFDEEEEEEESRPNTFVVILLTILIVCLLVVAGFIFVKYFLPNMGDKEPAPTTAPVQMAETTEVAETTEATIPCEHIIMNNEAKAELSQYGQQFLLNVVLVPENTTDKVVYTSADENIAVVSEDGKITAIAEGETTIYISCGKNSIECPVAIKFVHETQAPVETEPAVEETVPAEETIPAETVPEETTGSSATVDPNVVLKLKKTDIQLGVYYYFTLQLDCELDPTQVEWRSEHPHIAKVDEKGVVTALQAGTTAIIAKYGDQEVQCMVRCGWY